MTPLNWQFRVLMTLCKHEMHNSLNFGFYMTKELTRKKKKLTSTNKNTKRLTGTKKTNNNTNKVSDRMI